MVQFFCCIYSPFRILIHTLSTYSHPLFVTTERIFFLLFFTLTFYSGRAGNCCILKHSNFGDAIAFEIVQCEIVQD